MKDLDFSKKILYLLVFCIAIAIIGLIFINNNHIFAMQAFAGVLIGVVTFFLVTAVLKGVLKQLKTASGKFYKDIEEKISQSIDKEKNEEDIRKKRIHYRDREILYETIGLMDIKNFRKAIKYGFIVLILSVLMGFFEFDTWFQVTNERIGEVVWTLSSWHIEFVLIVLGACLSN